MVLYPPPIRAKLFKLKYLDVSSTRIRTYGIPFAFRSAFGSEFLIRSRPLKTPQNIKEHLPMGLAASGPSWETTHLGPDTQVDPNCCRWADMCL